MGMLDDVKAKKKQKAAENWMKMADSAKTIEKQIEYYTKSLDVDPYNAEAWFKKGKGLEKIGRFEEAKKCFDLAIEIDPDYQGLIGRKYESNAAHAVSSEPVVEETAFISEPSIDEDTEFVQEPVTPVLAEEKEPEEQWVTETPEYFREETGAQEPDDNSFRAPMGDESAFSDVFTGDDEDNGSPTFMEEAEEENVFGASSYGEQKAAQEAEASVFAGHFTPEPEDEVQEMVNEPEDTFSAPSSPVQEEAPSAFSYDENVVQSSEPEVPASDVTGSSSIGVSQTTIRDEPVSSSVPSSSNDGSVISGSVASAGVMAGAGKVAVSGDGPVDIRIPLNEAIKFWAIGVASMLIVLIISRIL
ncbi:tetratricopeptide repeat protein [Methanolobus profundi]|uniref:Tetratricopeptide repeat-containing protein n=1 Tax=Methanolobus profundi TaxID=487685 RepID=A0A1I4NLN3_9EURY|nr:tetratricopeptide repeat protein [Methanolobus profundi]SFM16452.1 Tetratricopeptide repeat-containing protein [Methanolobus profundi]